MAKIKYSALVSGMRNKLNGSVAAKNRYGDYWRNKTSPVNPQTTYQMAQRGQFGNLSQQWRNLTQPQRDSWINAAEFYESYTDAFGDKMKLAGNALFISLNKNLMNTGQPTIAVAPNPGDTEFAATIFIDDFSTPGVYELNWGGEYVDFNGVALLYAAVNVPASRLFVKNDYRIIGHFSAPQSPDPGGKLDITTMLTDRFGTPITGTRMSVKMVIVNDKGQVGVPAETTLIV